MNYRLEEKAAFRIVGISKRVPIRFNGVNPEIAAMWQQLTAEQIARMKALSNLQPPGILQASTNFSSGRMEEQGGLDHYIGAATTNQCPGGFDQLEVPASTWAVFTAVGPFPETLQNTWGRIYAEWFPAAGYELAPGPEILWNESKDTRLPMFKSEIWMPVRKRQETA